MKTLTKLMIAAAPAMMVAAPSFAAVTAASDSLQINLNGEVASVCVLTPDAPVSKTIDMNNANGQQSLTNINYGCNSPYKVTLKSANGGMKHGTANSINVRYDVRIANAQGQGPGSSSTISSNNLTGAGQVIVNDGDWANLANNSGQKVLSLDLEFNHNDTNRNIAGTYSDTLTVAITAQL